MKKAMEYHENLGNDIKIKLAILRSLYSYNFEENFKYFAWYTRNFVISLRHDDIHVDIN